MRRPRRYQHPVENHGKRGSEQWLNGISGNWESRAKIESLFLRPIMILPDQVHSLTETRFKAIGRTAAGRHIFLVFTIRDKQGKSSIRLLSARYMHSMEVQHYEKENPPLRATRKRKPSSIPLTLRNTTFPEQNPSG